MNLLMGVTKKADEDYEQLCYLLIHHGSLEMVCEKCNNVVDAVVHGLLEKLEIEDTDENFMKFIEGIIANENFDEVCNKFNSRLN